ncbi:palmitoyltransferase ZDHHC20-B-like isoform X2 [Eriocheir sinensis]|uniref:palmitoyltransferase ZDHHC20-B-like isoform X2 n=1 Tax=Eriocheir sinensis TaxID=95602 RepID=UPI0021C7C7BC|nr:palmitoyltransferase ZDHHC20-B-like isoform X2 [Eriocheir sinensis]
MAPRFCGLSAPCRFCFRAAKWLPVLFIVTVVVWSYYAYVLQLNLFTITNIVEKCFYLIVYHILLTMFLWAYWQTIFTDIGTVPKQFRLPPSELDRYEGSETEEARRDVLERFTQKQNLPIYNRTIMGEIRYCERCVQIKPDRCHHCSVCGVCVLKLDHHCPWVNNCVSFTNYKFFILFLGYALIYCLFIAATTLQYFIMFWRNQLGTEGKFHILFVFFVSIMFAISLVSLFGYHVFLVLKNRSTLESFRGPIFRLNHSWVQDKDGFSLGAYNNFVEVFGEDRAKWFLPVATSLGDGVTYPVRGQPPSHHHHHHHNHHHHPFTTTTTTTSSSTTTTTTTTTTPVQSYGSTQISLGDGVTYPQRCIDEDMDGLLGPTERWADEDESEMAFTAYTNNHNGQSLEEVVVQPNHTNPV